MGAVLAVLLPTAGPPRTAHAFTTVTVSNATPISIPAGPGNATPYPSTITVSGVNGKVVKATVTLNGLTHTRRGDLEIGIQGPRVWGAVLMSDVGGTDDFANTTLTFDDAAAGSVPNSGNIGAGPFTYKPTQGPGASDPFGGFFLNNLHTPFGFFDAPANGDWKLFVHDDTGGVGGTIMAGWTLTLTVDLAPTATDIPDVTTSEDTPTAAVPFTVNDAETPANDLNVILLGISNDALVRGGNVVFEGTGANRSVKVTPSPNAFGTTEIWVGVSDGENLTEQTFVVTVTPVNDPPTISNVGNRATLEDTPTAPILFFLGDIDSPVEGLTLSGSSSNQTLVPDANIAFGGSGANRTVTVTPAPGQSGTATITVTVSDGALAASDTLVLTVNPINDRPTISDIPDQSAGAGAATAIPFTVGDTDTPVESLAVSASSSDPGLVPSGAIALGGSGADRTITVTPAAGQSGSATITVTVGDGQLTASDSFVLTVIPSAPTSADLAVQTAATPRVGTAGRPLQYVVTVTNNGPAAATGVRLFDSLPGVRFSGIRSSRGSCGAVRPRPPRPGLQPPPGGRVICNIGTLAPGASATLRLVATPPGPGTVRNVAELRTTTPDPRTANNRFTLVTTVRAAP